MPTETAVHNAVSVPSTGDVVSGALLGHLVHIPPSKHSRSFGAHMTETLIQAIPLELDRSVFLGSDFTGLQSWVSPAQCSWAWSEDQDAGKEEVAPC